MKSITLLSLIVLLVLAGCASMPTPVLNQPPVIVEIQQASQYWVVLNDGKKIKKETLAIYDANHYCYSVQENMQNESDQYLNYEYSIDSNGMFFNPVYSVGSKGTEIPAKNVNSWGRGLGFGKATYVTVESNVAKTPITIKTKIYLVKEGSSCRPR